MSDTERTYYCDYCGRELAWDEVTYDERHEACGNRVGGEFAGRDHARVRALEARAERDKAVVEAAQRLIDEGAPMQAHEYAGLECCYCGAVRYATGTKHQGGCEWTALDAALAAREQVEVAHGD